MFQLNPLDLPGAWWQHSLMLLISGIIGCIIGFCHRNATFFALQSRLAKAGNDLLECEQRLVNYTTSATKSAQDDLKVIEGIGPQIEKLLYEAGVCTYGQLSVATPAMIKETLAKAGSGFQMHNPQTWPRQAMLAAAGQWDELYEWQDTLDGGNEFFSAN